MIKKLHWILLSIGAISIIYAFFLTSIIQEVTKFVGIGIFLAISALIVQNEKTN